MTIRMLRWPVLAAAAAALAGCRRGAPVDATVAIEHVIVIDGTDRGARPDMTVAIREDRIVAVGPSAEVRLGEVGNRIDGRGMYLIPGLWDSHVHLEGYNEHAFPLFLANGVTTIRDMGGDLKETGWLRQEVRAGRIMGPDMLITGPVLDAPAIVSIVPKGRAAVPTPEAGRTMVDSLAGLGIDAIKVHSATPRGAYFAILAEAKRQGIPVVGHVPDSIPIQVAIDSGQRTIEHHYGVPYANSKRGPELLAKLLAAEAAYTKRAGANFALWPSVEIRFAWLDSAMASLDYPSAAAFAKEAARRPVWFDPTLGVIKALMLVNEPGIMTPPELKFVPKAAREYQDHLPPKEHPSQADLDAGRAQWSATLKAFRELIREKAKFLAGSDVPVMPLVPGFSLQRELALLVEAGLSPLEALQAATRNPAQAMSRADEGTVEKGKVANLVLLESDPLADIGNLKSIQTVILRGRLLSRTMLDRMLQDAQSYAAQR